MKKLVGTYCKPVQLLQSSLGCEGRVSLAELGAVTEVLESQPYIKTVVGGCSYNFDAQLDELGKLCVYGEIDANIMLICQRCMEDFDYKVNCNFKVYPLKQCELKGLPKQLEPLILSDKEDFDVNQFIGEEILLNLPYAPKHQVCQS